MNVWALIKLMKPKHIWSLSKLCLRNVLFVIPTLQATKNCVKLSNEHFGRLHHQNNSANAFRHAVWNYLIAKKCFWWRKNEEKVVLWAKKITDWHEDFSPNSELAKLMDFHNNKIGRTAFIQHKNKTVEEVVLLLKKMTEGSAKISSPSEIESYKNKMVHIV